MSKHPSTAYARGRAFEYRVKGDLERHGFIVIRSPQSRSPFDLVALRVGVVLMIQCKSHGVLSPSEWNSLLDVGAKADATCLLASRHKRTIQYHHLLSRKVARGRQPMVPVRIIGERSGKNLDRAGAMVASGAGVSGAVAPVGNNSKAIPVIA
jgi:Holliday junction resolvase